MVYFGNSASVIGHGLPLWEHHAEYGVDDHHCCYRQGERHQMIGNGLSRFRFWINGLHGIPP